MKYAIEAPPQHALSIPLQYEALRPGDLITTGNREGVNAVVPADGMRGGITGLGEIEVRVEG